MDDHKADQLEQRKHFERRRTALNTERGPWKVSWKEIAQYIAPEYDRFENRGIGQRGNPDYSKILDNTATQAAEITGSGLMGVISNPAREWFGLGHPNPLLGRLREVTTWLDEATEFGLQIMALSNVYRALPKVLFELPVFGTACMFAAEDDAEMIRCHNFPPGEYMLAQDHRGVVNTVYRDFPMTVEQLVTMFGRENVSKNVKHLWDTDKHDTQIIVTHAIEPKTGKLAMDAELPIGMEFREVYFEPTNKAGDAAGTILREGGFWEWPCMAPRWKTIGTDVYGYGRGHAALPDIKSLQYQAEAKIEAIEKSVNPPLKRPVGSDTGPVNTLPGGITTYDPTHGGGGAIGALYDVNLDMNSLREDIAVTRDRINSTFYVDVFTLLTSLGPAEITARHVEELREEKVLRLGEVSQNMDQELYNPLITRLYGIAGRRGALPPPPEAIAGDPLRIKYFSVLHTIQKAQGLGAMDRLAEIIARLSEAKGGAPEPWDKLDDDALIDEYALGLGTPPKLILPADVVIDKRQQRNRAIQMRQSAETAKVGAEAARALSQTDTEGPNVLSQMSKMAGTAAGGPGN